MRYCVFSKTLEVSKVSSECQKVGARNMRVAVRLRQVFCDLSSEQVAKLSAAGLKVKETKTIKPAQIAVPTIPTAEYPAAEVGMNLAHLFNDFRGAFTPPLIGEGLTVVIMDSGIRKTHESLEGKVILEENFSDSETCDDVYDHGTGVAYIVAGGSQGDINSGIAPGAKLMNMKVLGDDGEGIDEWLITALDRVCDLVQEAKDGGKPLYDPNYPNVVNISVGAEDDGDPDNPVREACHVAVDEYGLQIIASAGNSGDRPGTVLLPAVDEKVVAIGGLQSDFFDIWEQSGRGPTLEGLVKPDFVLWATNILQASSEDDDTYTYKTGTSFSAPIASGIIGLINDLGRRSYGNQYYATWYQIENVAEMVCIKPEGELVTKDNAYGFGLPALRPLFQGVTGPVAPTTDIMSMAVLMIIMMPIVAMARG